MPKQLNTDRLVLKIPDVSYEEVAFKEFTKDIARYMHPKPAANIGETRVFLEDARLGTIKGTKLELVVLDKKTNEFLGMAGIYNIKSRIPEFGVWIKKSSHGNKYGREAISAIKDWADKNLEYDYILYPVARENIASRKIPESFGGQIAREYDDKNQAGVRIHWVEYRIYR